MLEIINPSTEKVIAHVESDDEKSIAKKFALLSSFASEWRNTAYFKRAASITLFATLLNKHGERLAEILCREMGKPLSQARSEIAGCIQRIHYFLQHTPAVCEKRTSDQKNATVEEFTQYEPLGVIANISAWNYPYFVGGNVFIPALLTGNCVAYKASEFAALSGKAISELLYESGIPQGAFQVLFGDGLVGELLLEQNIDGIFFTGSKNTGLKIARALKDRLIPMQFELGGKDPIYVCDDADLESAAVSLADGAFYNAGQSCCSVERIYVHSQIYSQFIERFVAETQKIIVGSPEENSTTMGPLTRKSQIEVLKDQIADALKKGGIVASGANSIPGPGYYFSPTVIIHASQEMKCMREESFGPIVAIAAVESDQEAIEKMNDSEYGLTAGVYSQSKERAQNILSQVAAGTVYINCCDRVSPYLPWSGRKNSGLGYTLSLEGIRAFVKAKAWHVKEMA